MRGGTVIGVLVVQNRTRRHYSEEEEEALQTTAMVLAEVIASGELREVAREVAADVAHMRSHHLRGESLAEGIALGNGFQAAGCQFIAERRWKRSGWKSCGGFICDRSVA
jgi:signal transduction protein with GAF and PtsI domain